MVLDLVARLDPAIRGDIEVFTLDTGRLPAETSAPGKNAWTTMAAPIRRSTRELKDLARRRTA